MDVMGRRMMTETMASPSGDEKQKHSIAKSIAKWLNLKLILS